MSTIILHQIDNHTITNQNFKQTPQHNEYQQLNSEIKFNRLKLVI